MEQWGVGTTDANGDVYITFPISFPMAFSSLVATHVGGDGAMVILVVGTGTKQGCRLKARNFSGQVQAGWSVNYFAKGY
ncbi:gp53-like domain-containing protein [Pseudomonas mandelii]|uniref:gp53-like domain-containing protein n=1 Tax=Pseudomonas mandelii TaxID=75612 RepID=UPI003D2F6874